MHKVLVPILAVLALAGCVTSRPTIQFTLPPTLSPSPSPTPSPSPVCTRLPESTLVGSGCVQAITAVTVDDQVTPSVIPQDIFQAAANSWGMAFSFDGPPNCMSSPPGVDVFCMVSQDEGMRVGLPASWLGGTFTDGSGSILSPRLIGMPRPLIQEVLCHEIGNALGVPEHGPAIHDCMATPVNGALNPPAH